MTNPIFQPGVAGVRMPYGQPVRREGNGAGRLFPLRIKLDWQGTPVPEIYDGVLEMVGVLRRKTGSVCRRGEQLPTHAEEGEAVDIATEGHIMAVDGDGLTISVNLSNGRAI